MVVTYEFDATGSTGVLVSVVLPCRGAGPMGGTTDADYQSLDAELWIEEPATITTKQIAFYAFWEQAGAVAGLNMRVGTGSFVTYTDAAAVLGGSNGAMIRNDSAYTLARGRNTLRASAYRTDTSDLGFALSGFWIVTYTAGKPGNGYGAANHTIRWPLKTMEGASASAPAVSATAPVIADSAYFMSNVGVSQEWVAWGGAPTSISLEVEQTSGEGGVAWLNVFSEIIGTDSEIGARLAHADLPGMLRWTGDVGEGRMDVETSRRWRGMQWTTTNTAWRHLDLLLTYHSNTFTVGGTLSGGFSGTTALHLEREISSGVWEHVLTDSRSGDGAYSFTWYDSAQNCRVIANDGTHKGVSSATTAV